MKEQSSRSAEGVAMLRAIESEKPEGERVCYDPYAQALIPGGISNAISKWIITSGIYEKMAPGAAAFITLRERYIDDFLTDCLGEGLDQVVILGAGFDTRAYRIPGIQKTRVYEVDQPATQEVKLERLKEVIDPLPAYVSFVPMDFNTQSLAGRLPAAGYDEGGKTLFVWQGVTYFLTTEGVEGTLSFIADHSGLESTLIFDYFYNEILRDPSRKDVQMLRRASRLSGEQYMFGIDRGQIEPFLVQRGFKEIRNRTLEDLKQLYFTGSNAGRAIPSGIDIVSARVA
jgi:methyltransferase (TIGR00027 family)